MSRAPSGLRAAALVGHGVILELTRRRDAQVAGILMAVFAAGCVAARVVGIENAATGTFLLNLGLMIAYGCAHVVTLLLAARQMPEEIENRTLYPLLAKPLGRSVLLAGKWSACALSGTAVFLLFFFVAWFAAPHLERYEPGTLAQMLALQPLSIALVAALALAGSLVLPRGVNLVLWGVLIAASGHVIALLQHHAGAGAAGGIVKWAALYIPDFGKLNLITRYTDGQPPVGAPVMAGLAAYAAIPAAAALALAGRLFRRRPL